jgi:hypothetical protein
LAGVRDPQHPIRSPSQHPERARQRVQRQANQRVDQISDDVYGEKTLTNFLNRAAFAQPAPGAFGTYQRNSIDGPGFWKIDLAISRLVSIASTQNLELRVEVFNLTNNFNWDVPNLNFAAAPSDASRRRPARRASCSSGSSTASRSEHEEPAHGSRPRLHGCDDAPLARIMAAGRRST